MPGRFKLLANNSKGEEHTNMISPNICLILIKIELQIYRGRPGF